ncbi:MAG: beta-N-acetylhexosaminidase [Bacteroidales bacterium]|nr:beta-N-acetylhexosaminidase [Bacteroidales bacterium]
MKRLLAILSLCLFALCARANALEQIVPRPMSAELHKGSLRVSGIAFKCDPAFEAAALDAVERFAAQLGYASGKTCVTSSPLGLSDALAAGKLKGFVFLHDASLAPEAYSILVAPGHAVVRASGLNGVLYALQTLRQMLPAAIYGKHAAEKEKWVLPCCEIRDEPRFAYRGMHLDSSRHFWSVEEVKRYLDVMAMYKLNRFHWHLTDDQGWRIEIKAYPLLSQVSCWREGTMVGHDFSSNDGIRYGGFYTQDEIRDVVAYAAARGITVVPEVDLPGHMLAAMAAYPELGCTGGPYAAWTIWGVSDQVLCPGKEGTFRFLEAVLSEVAELFPGEYIHIGGDECPKSEWKKCPDCQALIQRLGIRGDERFSAEQYLQNYVTKRVQDFLATKGKKVIGWDEILEGQLAPGATVMSWRGTAGAKQAAAQGFDAILTPTSHCYFDYLQSEDKASEPLGFNGVVTLEKIYSLDPLEGIAPEQAHHILGVQANLWTEYISTPEHLEYMLLPRLLALSEVQWCQPGVRDEGRFLQVLQEHQFPVLEQAGYNYRKQLTNL